MTEKISNRVPYITKDFSSLLGINGLSDQLLNNHFALYRGYVTNVNKITDILNNLQKEEKTATPEFAELKRRFGWEWNGMRLHELYFENLTKNYAPPNKTFSFVKKVTENFGSLENWEKEFHAIGAMRGIGWIITYYEPQNNRIYNAWINEHDSGHLCGAIPLLVMDVFEHAYMPNYGIKKAEYIDTFMKIIDWDIVAKRFDMVVLKK